jgi:hypothetical protein
MLVCLVCPLAAVLPCLPRGARLFRKLSARVLGYKVHEKKMTSLTIVLGKIYGEYVNNTSKKLKIIDAYLLYVFLTGVIQFVYCCLVGTFPFNSFLSGFISSVSCFVLAGW